MAEGTRVNVVISAKLHRAARVRMAETGETWEQVIEKLLIDWLAPRAPGTVDTREVGR
jgi:hypothetical protein